MASLFISATRRLAGVKPELCVVLKGDSSRKKKKILLTFTIVLGAFHIFKAEAPKKASLPSSSTEKCNFSQKMC